MKKRIKIDSSILSFVIIVTGFLYLFPGLYLGNKLFDSIFDIFGVILIIKGNLLRMCARGHKKMHSQKGETLVTTGPYQYTRNPMYLGSFLIGAGFVLLVWPWWTLPLFAWLFYIRFSKQVEKEEAYLNKLGDAGYKQYCEKIPRIFPSYRKTKGIKTKDVFNLEEAFITKEWRNLAGWTIFALFLELFQEKLVFGATNFDENFVLFGITLLGFIIGFGICYKYR